MSPPHPPAEAVQEAIERIDRLRQDGHLAEALHEAAEAVRSSNHFVPRHVWRKFFLGEENLAWQYARALCQPSVSREEQEACMRDVQGLAHKDVLAAAATIGNYQSAYADNDRKEFLPLRGLIDTVRYAVADALRQ